MALIKLNDVDVSLPEKQVSDFVDSSSIPEVNLNSERGVDYSKLCDILTHKKWREADIETAKLMLKIANRENRKKLNVNSINNLPCTDLRTINQLWVKYSNGKFGFSAQKEIWENLPAQTFFLTYEKFGDRLGWHSIIGWTNYDNLDI
ncbi:GUN4 domain-containing protein [Okeania sp. KiyG1]|uniref:GUN4 domain-containing protein n=1 Tax=Okeania sp. KiyG1 TaxID=2720165 RepID=UPI0021042566|nr:GUN4 domain-containing protein [Okeania sp. KiyG1]